MAAKDAPWPVQYAGRYGFPGIVLCALGYWGSIQFDWFKKEVAAPAVKQHISTLQEMGEAVKSNSETLEALHENVKGIQKTQERLEQIITRRSDVASTPIYECDP